MTMNIRDVRDRGRYERGRTKHHERSHEGSKEKEPRSKRKDREEGNGVRAGNKISRVCGERRTSRFEDVAAEVTEAAVAHKPTKSHVHVLRVDAFGREIDEHGNVISVTKPSDLTTLKVNINKHKKDVFQIDLKPQLEVDPQENPHYDPRIGIDKSKILRPKRMSFKVKQAHLKKAKDDDMNPNLIELSEHVSRKENPEEPIPDHVEWWDAEILTITELLSDANIHINDTITESHLRIENITRNIEHPCPLEPLAEAASPPP